MYLKRFAYRVVCKWASKIIFSSSSILQHFPSPYTLVLGRMVFLYQGYRAYFPRADLSQFGPAQVSGSESNCRNGLQFLPNYEQGLLATLPAGVADQFLEGGCPGGQLKPPSSKNFTLPQFETQAGFEPPTSG